MGRQDMEVVYRIRGRCRIGCAEAHAAVQGEASGPEVNRSGCQQLRAPLQGSPRGEDQMRERRLAIEVSNGLE